MNQRVSVSSLCTVRFLDDGVKLTSDKMVSSIASRFDAAAFLINNWLYWAEMTSFVVPVGVIESVLLVGRGEDMRVLSKRDTFVRKAWNVASNVFMRSTLAAAAGGGGSGSGSGGGGGFCLLLRSNVAVAV